MTEIGPRLSELLAYIDGMRARLVDTASQVNQEFATIRPRSGVWSAAETLSHLAMVEAGVARMIEKSVRWARSQRTRAPESQASVIGTLDRFRIVDSETKLTSPPFLAPAADVSIEESLESLRRTRLRVREALIAADDIDLLTVKRPHPVLGEIDMYQWAVFVAQHEERHRRQIDRVLEEVTGRAAECAPIV